MPATERNWVSSPTKPDSSAVRDRADGLVQVGAGAVVSDHEGWLRLVIAGMSCVRCPLLVIEASTTRSIRILSCDARRPGNSKIAGMESHRTVDVYAVFSGTVPD